jgi:membrane protein DedA with SNARE-associated domain
LLFVDETGIPLPIAPNEGLLLLTGVLISTDAFSPWVILPIIFVIMAAGMVTGYGWARTVGQTGLQSIATRVHATAAYERAQARLRSATPWGIAVSRILPGLRPYATLVSGAAGVNLRTFLLGALPALLVWEMVWVFLGIVVGLPVAHLLGRFERVALRGGVLILLAVVAWYAIRHASDEERAGVARIAPRLRASLALVVDAGIVFSAVGGILAIIRRLVHLGASSWLEPLTAACVLVALLLVGRTRQTPGERLFETHYWHGSKTAP